MAIERKGSYSLVPLLTSAGLISGLITAALDYPAGKLGEYFLGGVFGTIIAVALAVGGVLPKFWRAILLPVAAAVVFYLSWYSAGIVELGLASGNSSMGQPFNVSPIAMFVGGVIGGFGVLGVILALVQPQVGMRTHAVNAVAWSLIGGLLGVVGWLLGPSLGMAIWSSVHDLGLATPTETFQNALYGQTSHVYSLFVVWQTGMALVLAIMLLPSKRNPAKLA